MEISEKNTEKQDFENLPEGSEDELNKLKVWLFKENIRLQALESELKGWEDKLTEEKKQIQEEMKKAHRKLRFEEKRLKQNEDFFEQKMDILKRGFVQLDIDRKKMEKERLLFEAEKKAQNNYARQEKSMELAEMLFQGVNSQLALKKRYRDLIKMFHPDNLAGDHEMILIINKIYEELKRDYEMGKRA